MVHRWSAVSDAIPETWASHGRHGSAPRRRAPASRTRSLRFGGILVPRSNIGAASGRNSVAECQLPKLDVAGSNPVGRSNTPGGYGHGTRSPLRVSDIFGSRIASPPWPLFLGFGSGQKNNPARGLSACRAGSKSLWNLPRRSP